MLLFNPLKAQQIRFNGDTCIELDHANLPLGDFALEILFRSTLHGDSIGALFTNDDPSTIYQHGETVGAYSGTMVNTSIFRNDPPKNSFYYRLGTNSRDTQWHHMLFTRRGQTVNLYIDSCLVDSEQMLPGESSPKMRTNFSIGSRVLNKQIPSRFYGIMEYLKFSDHYIPEDQALRNLYDENYQADSTNGYVFYLKFNNPTHVINEADKKAFPLVGLTTTGQYETPLVVPKVIRSATLTGPNCSTFTRDLLITTNQTSFSSSIDGGPFNAASRINGLTPGVHQLVVKFGDGCLRQQEIIVPQNPIGQVTLGSNSPVCDGAPIRLNSAVSGDTNLVSYLWTGPAGTNFTSTYSSPVIPVSTLQHDGTYSLKVTTATCTKTVTLPVTAAFSPSSPQVQANTPVCIGNPINAKVVNPATNVKYYWHHKSGGSPIIDSTTWLTINTAQYSDSGEYLVIASNKGCQSNPGSIEVEVLTTNPPSLGPDSSFCDLTPMKLSSRKGAFATYQWSTGATTPVIDVTSAGEYVLSTVDSNGCPGTDTLFLRAYCPIDLYAPNTFTPDGDGINDVYRVYSENLVSPFYEVFNRWGEKIYETTNPNFEWDGRYMGLLVRDDVYIWRVKARKITETGETVPFEKQGKILVMK